ncbi:MAG TPA: periplasmic heavy metal sensor [Pyrinomonadaceae bacterium]
MNTVAKNKWQVRLAAAIIFVLGFTAGILALNVYRGLGRNGGPDRRFEELSERLQLTAEQKTKVQEIFGDTREQLRALRRESEPKVDEIRRQADGRLQTVLTPEQWQQFQKIRDERQRRGGRGGPGGPRGGK